MVDKLTEAFDFADIEQDEIGLENTITSIRILGKIEEEIKKESSFIVRHQVSDSFYGFIDFVEQDLPYIASNREKLLRLLGPSKTLTMYAVIKDRDSEKIYGIGTRGFTETINQMFLTIKKAFNILGFNQWQNISQKIKIKVIWNNMKIPYTGEDFSGSNLLRDGIIYSLYKTLLDNIEYVVNTFSFDLNSIVDGGKLSTYIGHFNLMSQYADPGKDKIKKRLKDNFQAAVEDGFNSGLYSYQRITTKEFLHILKLGKEFIGQHKNSLSLLESFDFSEESPLENIDSQIADKKELAIYKSSEIHNAIVDKFKKINRETGGYGFLQVSISDDTAWMTDYIVQDALDIFAEGSPKKFYEKGSMVLFKYNDGRVDNLFDTTPDMDKLVIDFDKAGKISNYLNNLVELIKKHEAKWIYDYDRFARFNNNLEIKGYNFSNLANLGYYIGFLLDGTLRLTVNGKKFYEFVAFATIRDEEVIEECLDRAAWYQILSEKFTNEELIKFTNDFIRGNLDRKNISFGLNESFNFNDEEESFDIDIRKIRSNVLVKEISKWYIKMKMRKPSPIWFLETRNGVVADLLMQYEQGRTIGSIPIVKIKIGGNTIVLSSEGFFKIENSNSKMTPISEMPNEIYEEIISRMENFIKDAKDFEILQTVKKLKISKSEPNK